MKFRSIAVVHLGRAGDLLLLLPALQHLAKSSDVTLLTQPEYAAMLAGIPWLTVEPINIAPQEWKIAQRHAEKLADRVILTQLAYVRAPRREPNFAMELWRRTGVPTELFHSLPLELPNRDAVAEQAVVDGAKLDGRPLVLVNTTGLSSPFELAEGFKTWLTQSFPFCQVLDLGGIVASRLIDLLGLYERAAALVSIDTATLHLGYATRAPTVALLADHPYNASPSRAHWRLAVRYADVPGKMAQVRASIEELAGVKAVDAAMDLKPQLPPALREFIGGKDGLIAQRQAACLACPDSVTVGGVARECQRCGCNLLTKMVVASERCPAGKWPLPVRP